MLKSINLKIPTIILVFYIGLNLVAQAPLNYQINQQGVGNCAGSPVELSVSTSVRLTTNDASEITVNTAISGGNVTNDGGNVVSQRGVCWNTSPNPTTANFSTSDGSGLGNFSSNLSGLSPNTTYFVRAYAINGVGTFYGNEVSFITGNSANPTAHTCGAENVHNPNLNYGTMTDQEGNVYKTIVIDTQEWMAENLKTSTYRNGDPIPNVTDNEQWAAIKSGAWCYYNNDPQFECPNGKLYNWYAVADIRNVCPDGWHIPSDLEWDLLIESLDPSYDENVNYGEQSLTAGGKMKSSSMEFWPNSTMGTNESGLSGLPSGFRGFGGNFANFNPYNGAIHWWTSTSAEGITINGTDPAWFRFLRAGSSIERYATVGYYGGSLRCVRESSQEQGFINGIDCNSATNTSVLTQGSTATGVTSQVSYTGGNGGTYPAQVITSTGVTGLTAICATGTFATGAGSLSYTISGTPFNSGTASFELTIGGQSCSIQIPVNAGQAGTPHSCGAENVHNPNLSYGSMTDQDGNIYKTIVIGNQEWMAENLKVSHYRNGDLIPNISDNEEWASGITSGFTTGASCWYNNDSASYDCPYGKLYNYFAVADSRNLCPSGWHVPTDAEWNELLIYLDSTYAPIETPGFQAGIGGGVMQSIGTYYWQDPNQLSTNSSGFSALPGGVRIGDFIGLGTNGHWWGYTEIDAGNAWYTYVTNYNFLGSGPYYKRHGSSVRCLKGENEFIIQGSINTLDCESASISGSIIQGTATNDLTISVPYTGGNGGTYIDQTMTSTGVTGLTATLTSGNFANGAGTLTYTISGTPENSGIAGFALSIGGQSCTLQIPVNAAQPPPHPGTPHSCGAENVHNPNLNYGSLTDQEGNIYKTIVIGNQEWMAENLKTSIYRNGDPIPNVTNASQWEGLSTGAWCNYNNDPQLDCPYGKLYNWYATVDTRNLCPTDWHVPTDSEWNVLIGFLDPTYNPNAAGNFQSFLAGGKLKSTGLGYWLTPNLDATNESGFSGLPGGSSLGNGAFFSIGDGGVWWSSTENIDVTVAAWYRGINKNNANIYRNSAGKRGGLSLRCLKD